MLVEHVRHRGAVMSARRFKIVVALVALTVSAPLVGAEDRNDAEKAAAEKAAAKDKAPKDKAQWRPLFDGKSLAGWKTTQFGAHGEPEVKDGQIIIPAGDPLSG